MQAKVKPHGFVALAVAAQVGRLLQFSTSAMVSRDALLLRQDSGTPLDCFDKN